MSSEETTDEQPEIRADEEWKQRVKAEDAALDQKLGEEAAEKESAASREQPSRPAEPSEIPPADFGMLVGMFSTQAMAALGVIPNPATGKAEKQPALARHFIDMLSVLEEKTKGNLDASEESLLNSTLHQLRMAFVQMSKSGN